MHGKKGFTPIMKEIRPSAKCGAKKLLHAALSRRYTPSSFPVLPDAELSALAAKQADARDEWLLHALQDHTAALLEGLPSNVMLSALSGIHADEGTVWLKPDGGRTLTPCWTCAWCQAALTRSLAGQGRCCWPLPRATAA
jgi:hypothetical protein